MSTKNFSNGLINRVHNAAPFQETSTIELYNVSKIPNSDTTNDEYKTLYRRTSGPNSVSLFFVLVKICRYRPATWLSASLPKVPSFGRAKTAVKTV